MLAVRQAKKPTPHSTDAVPEVSFILPRHDAKPVSKKPAIMSMIQFMR